MDSKGDEFAIDDDDWRTKLQPDSRLRNVNKIMQTLKRHILFSGQEGLEELKIVAVRIEEPIYTSATSLSDYLRTISQKMLRMETKSQNTMSNSLQASSSSTSKNHLDPAQTGNANMGDWQEEIYQKIQSMKDSYLAELTEMHQKISGKLQQHDSLPQQAKAEQLEKLKLFRSVLERLISVLNLKKNQIVPGYKEKLGSYEKQIVNFLHANRPRKPVWQTQALPAPHMHSMQQSQQVAQSQMSLMQSHENQMNPQMQSMNLQNSGTTMQQSQCFK